MIGSQGNKEAILRDIIFRSRRTVGLYRIGEDDLERMKQEPYGGAKTEEQGHLLAVHEYLKCELKIDSDSLQKMVIERIFAPVNKDRECLYVTFKHLSSVSRIYERTKIMRPESRILNYIPKQFNSRLRTVTEVEFIAREGGKYQTRVKMGLSDLELSRKLKGTKKWERVKLPDNLPEVELDRSPSKVVSMSPPPGRPGHTSRPEKRGRVSTGSQSDVNNPKMSRREDGNGSGDNGGNSDSGDSSPSRGDIGLDREAALKQSIEMANLVGPATISLKTGRVLGRSRILVSFIQ